MNNHQQQPSPMLPLEYRNLPVKFLGQRLHIVREDDPAAHGMDGGQVCKETIRFLGNLRSAKEHRYNKEKHMLLDIVPDDGEIVVRAKKKKKTAAIRIQIQLARFGGVAIIGRKFAIRERAGEGRCDTIYAFETERKGDDSALLTSLFGSIATLYGAPTKKPGYPTTAPEFSTELYTQDRMHNEVQVHLTAKLKAERAQLAAELRAMTLERECEALKRERAELEAEMTAFSSEVAQDIAAFRGQVVDDVHNSFQAELQQLKRGVAVLAARFKTLSDEGHAAATDEDDDSQIASFWEKVYKAGERAQTSSSFLVPPTNDSSSSLVLRLTERLAHYESTRGSRFARTGTSASRTSIDSGHARSAFASRHETDGSNDSDLYARSSARSSSESIRPGAAALSAVMERSMPEPITLSIHDEPSSPEKLDDEQSRLPTPIRVPEELRARSSASPAAVRHEVIEDIVIVRNGQPLGIGIAGGIDGALHDSDTAIYITSIQQGGAANATGCIQHGDKILVANGVDLEHVTHLEAVNAIRSSDDTVALTVSRYVGGAADITTLSEQTTIVEDVLEFEFEHPSDGLGFLIKGGVDSRVSETDPSIYVTQIIESGAAHKDGRLRVGDRLIEVNGVSTVSTSHLEAVSALMLSAGDRVHMVVSRLPLQQEEVLTIDFILTENGLGLSVLGGSDQATGSHMESESESGIFVNHILEGSSAAMDNRLLRGDRLLEVNGVSFVGMSHHRAVEVLSSLTGHITLKIARLIESRDDHDVFVEVTMQLPSGKRDLGFSIAGGVDAPMNEGDPSVYITRVAEGGFAHRDEQLRFGDKITSVNGIDFTNVTHAEAIRVIKEAKGELRMTLARLPLENEEKDDVLQVHLACRDQQKLGMQICGGIDSPDGDDRSIYIDLISAEGAAATDGRLKAGDKLLLCNGQSLVGITSQEARECLLKNLADLKLTISRKCV